MTKYEKRYLPTIYASDGRTYTNVSYKIEEEANRALEEFVKIFHESHDDRILDAYVYEYEVKVKGEF